jgi:DNA invertase Pin-like site-specific DNA recombinase
MQIKQWVEQKTERITAKASEVQRQVAAETAVARALGISVRQLRRRINREAANTVRATKPEPHFRAGLVARQKKARP